MGYFPFIYGNYIKCFLTEPDPAIHNNRKGAEVPDLMFMTTYASPVGILTLAAKEDALIGLWLEGQKHFADSIKEEMFPKDSLPVFDKAKNWLDLYFAGKKPSVNLLPLAPVGSAFRQEVWKILCEIPYGQTTTYGTIAREIARKCGLSSMSAQAVGGAVGHNPISIIIPCHRVLGSDGSLTGYAGGVDKKRWLLEHESKSRLENVCDLHKDNES